MRMFLYPVVSLFLLAGCTERTVKKAPLFSNLGNIQFYITTSSDLAQRYFNQGVALAYGFNHAEAYRSFREVARLDTNCAMAYWGMAIVLGPNINAPMDDADVPTAYKAVQKARALLDNESEKEKDLIYALSKRYAENSSDERSALDSAYSNAMRKSETGMN